MSEKEVIKNTSAEFKYNIFFHFPTALNLPSKPGPPGNQHPLDPGSAVGKIFSHRGRGENHNTSFSLMVHFKICNFML